MKVLIVGSGGREHAIAWKVAQSPRVDKIYCAPGNAGIEEFAECVPIGAMEFEKLVAFAKENEIDSEYLKGVIAEYEFSGNMDRDGIREQIKLPLLKARKLINKIEEFILENCLRFQ